MLGKILSSIGFLLCLCLNVSAQLKQGTTVKREGCTVYITLQIGVESDSSEAADVAMLQEALEPCWPMKCDMPCADPRKKICKLASRVIIKKWSEIRAADRRKYHHVKIVSGQGVSYVNDLTTPNTGKSSGGTWYRHEYSPKVYCHETLHLCGLPDHYRDCRANRIALGVDNCKDGDTCTAAQIAAGACPSCPGYEDDCLGNDVTKPFSCNNNLMEIVRMVHDYDLVCPDSCCELEEDDHSSTSLQLIPTISLDAGLAIYTHKNKNFPDFNQTYSGYNINIGAGIATSITDKIVGLGTLNYNYSSTSHSDENTTGGTTNQNNSTIRFGRLSMKFQLEYELTNDFSVTAGPEVGALFCAKAKNYGTSTYNGMTTSYGSEEFSKITGGKNIQLGFNLGLRKDVNLGNNAIGIGAITPYFNFYYPITNSLDFAGNGNKMYNINVGALYKFTKN